MKYQDFSEDYRLKEHPILFQTNVSITACNRIVVFVSSFNSINMSNIKKRGRYDKNIQSYFAYHRGNAF